MEDREPQPPKNVSLSLEVTTNCNSSCSHCFVRARGSGKSNLAPDVVQTIVREGYQAGYRHLHITGGEPLMWDGLHRVLDHAFATGYQTVFLNTNGTLLSGEASRMLSSYTGLTISITIQGPESLHDSMRGKGSYNKALEGLENALAAGLAVHVFTPVGRSLIPALPIFATGILETYPGIRLLNVIQLIRVPADIFDLSREVLTPEEFLSLVRMVALLRLGGLNIDILQNPLARVASRILNMNWLPLSSPLYQQGSLMITAQGRMTLAHSTTEDFGSYEPGILSKILNSSAYHRALSKCRFACGKCGYSDLCGAEGMARPSESSRDMCPQTPYCKRVLALASSIG